MQNVVGKRRITIEIPVEYYLDIRNRSSSLGVNMTQWILNAIVERVHKEAELNLEQRL
jgi:hypothetical protein